MMRRYGCDKIGIDDTAFHQVKCVRIEIVAHLFVAKIVIRPSKAGCGKNLGSSYPLMLEVVYGKANPLVMHTMKPVDF